MVLSLGIPISEYFIKLPIFKYCNIAVNGVILQRHIMINGYKRRSAGMLSLTSLEMAQWNMPIQLNYTGLKMGR